MITIHDEDIIRRLFKHPSTGIRQTVERLGEGVSTKATAGGITRREARDAMVAVCREWLEKKDGE
jgi:hypothetical protein